LHRVIRTLVAVALLLLVSAGFAAADQVSALAAVHHDGQTFLTWTSPPGTGWTYRVYASAAPMDSAGDLDSATFLGSVGDSTWWDRRYSTLHAKTFAFRVDSTSAYLTSAQGLFVSTAPADTSRYFAVTAQAPGGTEDSTLTPGGNSLLAPVVEHMARPQPVFQRWTGEGYAGGRV